MGGGEINEPQADVSVIERVREAISKLGFQGGEEEEFNKYVKKA
ncbi:MAG: hypothetical protein U9R08_01085 [Nanoarchaeota archaeon]|nr:hypothetical protein [Nanoarchaeota archaeon]